MTNRTKIALLSRGFDSQTIDRLSEKGYSLKRLKQAPDADLRTLGVKQDLIEQLRLETRPPIPEDIVIRVLHESKRTCCVCRDPSRPIVIHHIKEWAASHDHSEHNLVVVCIEHHDQAHTKKGLTLSLTGKQLKGHKAKWIETVKSSDAKAVLGLSKVKGATWDFFNHQRLFDLARMAKLKLRDFTSFEELRLYGMLTHDGLIASPKTWNVGRPSFRLYDVYEAMHLYFYTKQILEAVIMTLPIIDLSNRWSKSEIEALVKPGACVGLQAAFYFKKLNRVSKGRNQRRRGLRQRDGIEVTFEFDAWESTSSTSQNCHLSGYQTAVVILLVRSIQKSPQLLRISASCLAIGSGFAEGRSITSLRPPPSNVYYWPDSEEDEFMV